MIMMEIELVKNLMVIFVSFLVQRDVVRGDVHFEDDEYNLMRKKR